MTTSEVALEVCKQHFGMEAFNWGDFEHSSYGKSLVELAKKAYIRGWQDEREEKKSRELQAMIHE